MTRIKLELIREEEMGNSLIKYYDLLVEETKKGHAELVIDDKGNAVIGDIGIDKDSRNKGYGTQSIKALAEEHGGVYLAPTDEDNQRLYERLGEEDYYEYEIDQGYGVYFIEG